MAEALLTVKEAAGLLKMSPEAVYTALARRQLPCVRLGRRVRFKPEALERFLKSLEVDPAAPADPSGRRR